LLTEDAAPETSAINCMRYSNPARRLYAVDLKWRRGWDSNPAATLKIGKLLILQMHTTHTTHPKSIFTILLRSEERPVRPAKSYRGASGSDLVQVHRFCRAVGSTAISRFLNEVQ
jgi:hypothetical protein